MTKLQRFLSWLGENKPDLHSKYSFNFQKSTFDGEGLATNKNYQITDGEYKILCKIAQDWYAMQAA